jgi:hypothetical protein
MTALIGLILGMMLGIIGRALWLRRDRFRSHHQMQRVCREWAEIVQHEPSRAALLEMAENYCKAASARTEPKLSPALEGAPRSTPRPP